MARRIFISYQHEDQMKAKGFHLLRWSKSVDVEFVGRHLLDPVDSTNRKYIQSKVMEQLEGTSVTVVLIGNKTYDSNWVRWEIEKSLGKSNPNGILAIRLNDKVPLPGGSPVGDALKDAGAEVIDWNPHEFGDAIERAFKVVGRVKAIRNVRSVNKSCQR